jgi:hypothetical protein
VIAATAAVLVALGWRRLSIFKIVAMVLAHLVAIVLLIAGLLEWFFDLASAVGEDGDEGADQLVMPLVLVGAVLLSLAWFPALRRRKRRLRRE